MRRRVRCAEQRVVLTFDDHDVVLRPVAGDGPIGEAEWLSVFATGFDSPQDADEFGAALKSSVRLASVRANFGVDVGDESVLTWPGEPLREAAHAAGGQLHETVHGVQVVKTGAQDTWLWSRAELTVQTQLETLFGEDFSSGSLAARDGSQLALACDLFASADFETSDRARFIALVTAVEALAVDRYRIASELQAVVDGWLASLIAPPNGLDAEDLLRFRSRVNQLKQESITNSVRQVVNDYVPSTDGGASNGDFMAECYNTRSKLVHGATDLPDLASLRDRLRALVRSLIIAVAAAIDGHIDVADASSTS
jgi:hypothetical protein